MANKSKSFDFTMDKYYELCKKIISSSYNTLTIEQYLSNHKLPPKYIIIRHDVDRKPINSLKTAKLEHELGINATYYFRTTDSVFIPEIMQEIESMGHEIGFHYEVLTKANGDYIKAIKIFEEELEQFRKFCSIKTICMHGSPLSKYDNRDMWKRYDFNNFDILGEAYLSVNKDLNYFSDTGRSWNWKNKVRDYIPNKTETIIANSTNDLMEIIESEIIDRIYILSHPERWSSNFQTWAIDYIQDSAINIAKKAIIPIRHR